MSDHVFIFDTTLRDGEQSPGATMNLEEKLSLASQLESLGVDIIEAGFPAASQGDFEAVQAIAGAVKNIQVAALCRALAKDIDRGWEAIKDAAHPRIHTFLATSEIHMAHKLRKSREEVLAMAVAAVKHAASLTPNVEFSAEDASRSDWAFLAKVCEAVIDAGATTVNIPDTVGYAQPFEFGELIAYLLKNVPNSAKAVFSVHCHNDLGLAVANSLSAIRAGARQAEVTLCGIGERAGNASLEELVMLALPTSTAPAALSLATAVASYTGRKFSSIFEAQVVGTPLVASTSLTTSGTPQRGWAGSGPAASRALASARASSACTESRACTLGSVAAMRARAASVASTALMDLSASLARTWDRVSAESSGIVASVGRS